MEAHRCEAVRFFVCLKGALTGQFRLGLFSLSLDKMTDYLEQFLLEAAKGYLKSLSDAEFLALTCNLNTLHLEEDTITSPQRSLTHSLNPHSLNPQRKMKKNAEFLHFFLTTDRFWQFDSVILQQISKTTHCLTFNRGPRWALTECTQWGKAEALVARLCSRAV